MQEKLMIGKDVINYSLKYIKGNTLDFGAGIGKYRKYIEPRTTKYTTFDQSPESKADHIGTAQSSPFSNETFDTIFCTQVLEHVESPWLVVDELNRILKTGGICIITAPFCIPYHKDPLDLFRYSEDGLRWLFEKRGFKIIESGTYGGPFMTIAEFIHFSFFNPYKKYKTGQYRILKIIQGMASFLDKFSRNKIIYPNAYVIAEKTGSHLSTR